MDRPKSCWVILDHRHEPNQLAELVGYYDMQDAVTEALCIRNQRDCVYEAIEVKEIKLR
jgi:hypothetical protein